MNNRVCLLSIYLVIYKCISLAGTSSSNQYQDVTVMEWLLSEVESSHEATGYY